jgi:hypothetical protein
LPLLDAARLIALDDPPLHRPLLHRPVLHGPLLHRPPLHGAPLNAILGFGDALLALRPLDARAALLALRLRQANPLFTPRTLDPDPLLAHRALGAGALDALRALGAGALLHARAFGAGALDALFALRAFGAGALALGGSPFAALGLLTAVTVTPLGLGRSGDRQSGDGGDQESLGHREFPRWCIFASAMEKTA